MIKLLARIFIADHKNYCGKNVRSAYGILCSIVGIVLNILLFAFKIFAGILTGSIAVTADAFNNLSDAGSSLITLIGFKLASQKPDKDHPFGHGRFEYISGLIVSMIIIIMGVELVQSSVDKIVSKAAAAKLDAVSLVILICAIAVKLYMAIYNRTIGKKIDSSSMLATAADSLSDCVATSVVLLSMILSGIFNVNIDGWCGLAVAVFIIFAGINAAKETINPLLGQMPSKEFVQSISNIVMSYEKIVGIHDLVVHDYGPGRVMISLHAEVPDKADLLDTHDLVDNIEKELSCKLGCEAVIHMDPIATDNEMVLTLREKISRIVLEIDNGATIHDFRLVEGATHTNLIFDVVVPFRVKMTDEQIKTRLSELIFEKIGNNYFAVVNIDRDVSKEIG